MLAPYFFLGSVIAPHFFHSRIATVHDTAIAFVYVKFTNNQQKGFPIRMNPATLIQNKRI